MKTTTETRWCYYIPETQDPAEHGGYVPSMVEENEPGHSPMLGRGPGAAPWIWGKTLAKAQEVCDKFNADMERPPCESLSPPAP